MVFLKVTETLFSNIFNVLKKVIEFISPIIGTFSILLILILLVGLINNKSKKKFIVNNYLLFIVAIAVELFISLVMFNITIIKMNLFALVFSILIIVWRLKPKKIKKEKKNKKEEDVIDIEVVNSKEEQ